MTDTSTPNRILDIPEAELSPEQQAGIAELIAGRGQLLAPYRIWLHSPQLMRAMAQLGTFLNKQGTLSEAEVELGICLAAKHWAGEYVFRSHAQRCLELGVPRSVLQAVDAGQAPELDEPRLRAVATVARMAVSPGPGSDADFGFAVETLGRDGLAEAICLMGYYSAVAIGMKLHRVPPRFPAP